MVAALVLVCMEREKEMEGEGEEGIDHNNQQQNRGPHLSPRGKIRFPPSNSLTSFFLERAPGHTLVMPGITGISLALRGFLTRSKHRNSTRSGSPCSRQTAVNKRLESREGEEDRLEEEGRVTYSGGERGNAVRLTT